MKKRRINILDKKLEYAVLTLKVVVAAVGLGMFIGHFMAPAQLPKVWSYIATMGVVIIPDLFRLMKVEISRKLELMYLIFLIPSLILGIDFDWYRLYPIFDKLAHLASGVLTVFAADELLESAYKPLGGTDWRFKLLFMMALAALIAVAWECFEFLHDQLLGGQMQQLIVPGLADTMWDMIWALGGGLVTGVILLVHTSTLDK